MPTEPSVLKAVVELACPRLREITTDMVVLERLVSPAGKDVLDVGCGSGALVRALCARGARAIGVEISEDRLAVAREQDSVDRYLVGRAERLPLADASVDVVVFMNALHHVAVDQMTCALREARRVLRREGALYVAEPLPEGSFFELICHVEDERHVRRAAQEAVERADEAGLRRVTTVEYAVEGRPMGFRAFQALVVSVDPDRSRIFAEREPEITAAFEELGKPGAVSGERRFYQPMRVDVLSPDVSRGRPTLAAFDRST
ncbi:MAG: class I SAM-dependent methyltransferase [Actinomycetota bacterium]|nr:class I SAM-dependent methyltransferase [Actinomycetota bacterium]